MVETVTWAVWSSTRKTVLGVQGVLFVSMSSIWRPFGWILFKIETNPDVHKAFVYKISFSRPPPQKRVEGVDKIVWNLWKSPKCEARERHLNLAVDPGTIGRFTRRKRSVHQKKEFLFPWFQAANQVRAANMQSGKSPSYFIFCFGLLRLGQGCKRRLDLVSASLRYQGRSCAVIFS